MHIQSIVTTVSNDYTYNKEKEKNNDFVNMLGSSNKPEESNPSNEDDKKMTQKEYQEYIQKLVDDIESVMKTGYTKEELEALEEMLKNLRKLKEEYNENPSAKLKKKIEDMVSELEQMIAKMKQKGGLTNINFDNILESIKQIKEFDNPTPSKTTLQTLDILKGV